MTREVCAGFKRGDFLEAIYFEGDQEVRVDRDCDSIIVVMENGQMVSVPWFEVWKDNQLISKWNAASVEGVAYKLYVQEPRLYRHNK